MQQIIAGKPSHGPHIGENDTYIECVSIIGAKLLFNLKLLPMIFKQPDIWLLIVAFVVLMTVLDPTGAIAVTSYGVIAAIWLLVAVLYVGFTVLALTVLYFSLKNTNIRTVILPFVSLGVLSVLISLGTPIEKLFIGDLGANTTAIPYREIFLCFLIEQVFSVLYVSMGFPLLMHRLERAGTATAPSEPEPSTKQPPEKADIAAPFQEDHVIKFGTISLKVADICAASADEHYVRIQTVVKQELIRERFLQVISHLPSSLGFQIHRSHWVAFSAVEDIVQDGAQHSVVLQNGDKLPISKARRREFKDDLKGFKALQRMSNVSTYGGK